MPQMATERLTATIFTTPAQLFLPPFHAVCRRFPPLQRQSAQPHGCPRSHRARWSRSSAPGFNRQCLLAPFTDPISQRANCLQKLRVAQFAVAAIPVGQSTAVPGPTAAKPGDMITLYATGLGDTQLHLDAGL